MDLVEHLAVPYRLTTYAAPLADGSWRRFAEYPELGCVTYADTLVEAMDKLEAARVSHILECLAHGQEIPTPRPPLRWMLDAFDPDEMRELRARLAALRSAANADGANGRTG